MPKLPTTSGKALIACLRRVGYRVVRQRGSHVRLEKATAAGVHKLTVPNHDPIARGTLNDIITKVSVWNQMAKSDVLDLLR